MSGNKSRKRREAGLSLIELMISVTILAVGFTGLMALMMTAMESNNTNRRDTSSTTAAQTIMKTITAPPAAKDLSVSINDCAGNSLTVNTAVGGATLDSSGAVDFTQAAVTGYQANYVACGPSQEQQVTYDVRWNIQVANEVAVGATNYTLSKFVTVSARRMGANATNSSNGFLFSLPVTLRTLVGD